VTAERWELVKNLFESALTVSVADRASFLHRQCADDEEVRREVASLLESLDESGRFLESPLISVKEVVDLPPSPPSLAGLRVGAYELVREIGRGGMGTVYLATRADNEFKKRVAIKLIRGGMESDSIIRRFRNERQILARLEHPNIARLLDGGTTADGLPYFVMEYVEGDALTQYCTLQSLPLRERLDIFLKACSAVHYAHRRMIVHRDLKPGNILVKQDGTPKLLDFGIAKLMDPETAEGYASETTMGGFRIVTPAYASPEQMRGEPATIRSDVYALGVILFELIAGRRPSTTPGEDPLALPELDTTDSTRLLALQLRSVVHKAIQPDPGERYESVEDLSADISTCLAGAPIPNYATMPTVQEAIPPSPGSVAVLPFRLLGNESTSEGYLGLGITDALITKLSNVGRISVRSTSAVMKYAALTDSLAAGRELGVEFILEGRVQKLGDRVRVTVQLVHVQTDAPVWAASFDEHLEDLLRVEDSISEQVARALVPHLTGEEREQLARPGTSSARAHQFYLRGRWHWNKGTEESLAQALLAFMQAIAEDPEYAGAHAGVADYYVQLGIRGGLPPSESFAAAKDSANTALRIDPALAEAHASLGFATWAYDRDSAAAAHQFQLAIALNPDYAPAHHWLGLLNSTRGRPEMAIACLERARKLDPNRPIYAADLALCQYNARRFDRAIECCQNAIRIQGENSDLYAMLAISHLRNAQPEEALKAARQAIEASNSGVFPQCVLAQIEAAVGNRTSARTLLVQLDERRETAYVSGCVLALLHLASGHPNRALDELERAWRDRDWWVMWLGVGPNWDELRGNARFTKLLQEPPQESAATVPVQTVASKLSGAGAKRLLFALGAVATLALAVLIVFWTVRPNRVPFEKSAITKLTTNGIALRAAISPDGRYVAYVAGQDGKPVVWVRELNGSSAYRIAGPLTAEIRGLEFIRDGKYVSFVAHMMNDPAKGVLYAAPISGGAIQPLMSDVPGPVAVSPDGSKIAYYRANQTNGTDELFVRNADGSGEKVIASQRYPDRFTWASAPVWSWDGKRIACAVDGSDPSGFRVALIVVDLNGSTRSLKSPRWQWVGRMAWMKDTGGLLVIGQAHDSSFQQIWFVPVGRGEAVRVTNDLNDYSSISTVADGSALVSVQLQLVTNLYTLRPGDPSHGVQITPGGGRYFDLSWTPDGKIVYASDATGFADIWIMNSDGSNQRQLTKEKGRSYSPTVSPLGGTIAFHSNRDGNWNVWTMDLESSAARPLTRGTRDSNWPQFTPDGKYVVYHHTGLNAMFNLWKVPAIGGTAMQITNRLTMHPAVNRVDGRIACWYSADIANPHWKIAVFPPDGGEPLQQFEVSGTATYDSTLRWTPHSDGLTYVDDRNGVSNIWVQPLDGKPPHPLTAFTWGQVYAFDWSKDGRLVYSRGMSTSDVVLIRDTAKDNGSGWVK
jgi:serine/threonine protein kinase/Tol biopolymer transport system component/tetratricopeptide (TPR) repeat protein